jgi:CDP-glycerol glycerophosphotransferase
MSWYGGRILAWSLPRILRRNDAILFGSDRVDDPDAVVILDHLAEHSSRPLRWTARERPCTQLLGSLAREKVVVAQENTAQSLLAYAQAQTIFHTAGLYTSPKPAHGRTIITVWHGDGPKSTSGPRIRGTYTLTGVEYYSRLWAKFHGYPDENLLVTGRPRVDDLFRGEAVRQHGGSDRSNELAKLGLDERPVIWWLPTWRQDRRGHAIRMDTGRSNLMSLNTELLDRYQFVVKPHPLSAPTRWPVGWRVLDDSNFYGNGIRLYQILGQAHAILTDYSSVWTDFLNTSIPIGFVFDDLEQFNQARGFMDSEWHHQLPGPIIRSRSEFTNFVEQGWVPEHADRRKEIADQLGAVNCAGATARLFQALDENGVEWR